IDHDLLLVNAIVDTRQHRPLGNMGALIKRQLDDGGLNLREAQNALVRLDVPGNGDSIGAGRRIERPDLPSPETVPAGSENEDDSGQHEGALLAHQGITRSRKNPDRLPAEPDDAEPSRPEPTRSGVAVLLPSESRRDSHSRKES